MYREKRPKPKIGYFGSGLAAYWPQFPNRLPAILDTMERHIQKLESMGCEVVDCRSTALSGAIPRSGCGSRARSGLRLRPSGGP